MTDVNSTTHETPATLAETDVFIASLSQTEAATAPIEETLAEKIVRLEFQLAEARTGNLKRPITQEDGSTRYFADMHAESKQLLNEWALEVESSRRMREEILARNPVSYANPDGSLTYRPYGHVERPMLTEDEAVKLFGLAKWAALTPKQKAQTRTVTKRDVDAVDLPSIFGRTSSSRKAMELSSANPALYRLCKLKAQREGLL